MSYSYDRTAFEPGPVRMILDQWWNNLHDLERELEDSSAVYDRAASYAGGPGIKDAKDVMAQIKAAVKQLNDVTSGNGAFDKLMKAERDFIQNNGDPEQYIRAQQDRMGFR